MNNAEQAAARVGAKGPIAADDLAATSSFDGLQDRYQRRAQLTALPLNPLQASLQTRAADAEERTAVQFLISQHAAGL